MILNKLSKLFWWHKPPLPPLLSPEQAEDLERSLQPKQPPRGRVIQATKSPEYSPHTMRRGGRIVKAMPKQLRKLKEAQEGKGVSER